MSPADYVMGMINRCTIKLKNIHNFEIFCVRNMLLYEVVTEIYCHSDGFWTWLVIYNNPLLQQFTLVPSHTLFEENTTTVIPQICFLVTFHVLKSINAVHRNNPP